MIGTNMKNVLIVGEHYDNTELGESWVNTYKITLTDNHGQKVLLLKK